MSNHKANKHYTSATLHWLSWKRGYHDETPHTVSIHRQRQDVGSLTTPRCFSSRYWTKAGKISHTIKVFFHSGWKISPCHVHVIANLINLSSLLSSQQINTLSTWTVVICSVGTAAESDDLPSICLQWWWWSHWSETWQARSNLNLLFPLQILT